jgi:hypothetical protein
MADGNDGLWEKVRKELASPWDWVAAGVGGALGLGASAYVGGIDGGTSAGAGALAAVSSRKAAVAAMRRPQLRKRAQKLVAILKKSKAHNKTDKLANLLTVVQSDETLWQDKLIGNDRFEELLDQHTQAYRESIDPRRV